MSYYSSFFYESINNKNQEKVTKNFNVLKRDTKTVFFVVLRIRKVLAPDWGLKLSKPTVLGSLQLLFERDKFMIIFGFLVIYWILGQCSGIYVSINFYGSFLVFEAGPVWFGLKFRHPFKPPPVSNPLEITLHLHQLELEQFPSCHSNSSSISKNNAVG